ncbi:MAG: TIR domain-containing protein [Acetobacter sp.]|nr:TIR domain-containing protein [Acetobacter sp.]
MARRRVFFSFDYDDIWRVMQIRNHRITIENSGYIDAAEFEELEKNGEKAVKTWINEQLENTSVTVVLIGSKTSESKYVNYEIDKSYDRGNGLLGIYIHNIKDRYGNTSFKGKNPFDKWRIVDKYDRKKYLFSDIYETYDWKYDDGYNNFGSWIEKAAKAAGR